MADKQQLRVKAAPKQVLGWPDGRIGYVGLTIAPPGTEPSAIHISVPGGPSYVALPEVLVPAERFYRRAIEKGALIDLDAVAAPTPEQAAKPERNLDAGAHPKPAKPERTRSGS